MQEPVERDGGHTRMLVSLLMRSMSQVWLDDLSESLMLGVRPVSGSWYDPGATKRNWRLCWWGKIVDVHPWLPDIPGVDRYLPRSIACGI